MDVNFALAKLKGVSLRDKITFTRNLALIVKAGLSLPQGLEVLAKEAPSPFFKSIISQIRDALTKGTEFSQALKAYPRVFNRFYVSMVKTGEASGTLDSALSNLAVHIAKERALKSKIIGALIYPSIIVIFMIIVLSAMMIFVVPRLTDVFQEFGAKLPLPTRILIGTSNFMVDHFFLLLLFVAGAGVATWFFFGRTRAGHIALSWFTLHMPFFRTLTKKVNTAKAARALQTLVSSGVSILEALSITADVLQNHFYKEMFLETGKAIEKGKALHTILASYPSLYPPLATQLVAVGEQTGNLDVVLTDLANFYEEEVDAVTKNLSSVIEPLLMIVIGIMVGFLAISMLTPIYSLTSSVGAGL